MPYIRPPTRTLLRLAEIHPSTAGELNFLLTDTVLRYLDEQGHDYTMLNQVIGVLECVKLELYRRMVAVYEDQKCRENGDVYPLV